MILRYTLGRYPVKGLVYQPNTHSH